MKCQFTWVMVSLGILVTSTIPQSAEAFGKATPRNRKLPVPQWHDLGIEVFDGDPAANARINEATVNIRDDVRPTDPEGYVRYRLQKGTYPVRVESPGFDSVEMQVFVDRHLNQRYPTEGDRATLRVSLARKPVQSYNFIVEVFDGDVSANRRVPGATVNVSGDTRTSDGNGFTHFWVESGQKIVTVEAPWFQPFRASYVVDREHSEVHPSQFNSSYRVSLSAVPRPTTTTTTTMSRPTTTTLPGGAICTDRTVSDNNSGVPRALPNMLSVVEKVNRDFPGLIRQSCKEHGGNNDFLFRVVQELRKIDRRWGLNWKRGSVGSLSQDVVNYYRGSGPFENGTDTYVVDMIGGHCGDNPQPAWINQTGVGGAIGRWTIDPMPKCN